MLISCFIGFKKPQKVGSNLLIKMLIVSIILTTLSFMWAQNYKMGSLYSFNSFITIV